jgi:16S rRNA processing protein RimM
MAVVGAPHGVRGEMRVKSFTADPLDLGAYGPLFAADGRAFDIESGRLVKEDMLVVRLVGIADRDQAKALTGTALFVDRAVLPPPDDEEFYYADLIGLAVVDAAGQAIGTLIAIHDYRAGDFLEISPAAGGPTWLLPFSKAAVPAIDLGAGRVTIDPALLLKPDPRRVDPDEPVVGAP